MTALVMLLFFLSGACGLVYQVVWTRMMTHVFGATAVAVGTVLAAFMTGLAVGAWLLGRVADRHRNPLRLYALLEIGVAVAALLAHLLLFRIEPIYLAAYDAFGRSPVVLGIARFVVAFLLVMAPTVLMGATLPVLTRFVVRSMAGLGSGLSSLYAINTAGAVAGALAAGFVLIRELGIHGAVYVAAVGNIAIGVFAWLASMNPAPGATPAKERRTPAKGKAIAGERHRVGVGVYRIVLIGLGISGVTSFAYEIYWTRSLVFMLGNSTYAVTTMLVAFLSGIALGGYLIRFIVDRVADRVATFGWLQILIGAAAAAAVPLLLTVADPDSIRARLLDAPLRGDTAWLWRLAISTAVMLVPATLIGATFPLVGRIGVSTMERRGADVGRVYAINTVGNVLGALLPGLLLLRWMGIQRGVVTLAALNVAVGVLVLLMRSREVRSVRWSVPAAVVAVALIVAWVPLDYQFRSLEQGPWHRVLYYEDGPSGTTSVLLDPETGEKIMSVDGVDIGGSGATDFKQQLLAHLPKLLLDDVSSELSVGLGSGILAGESAKHDRVESLTCVEIEPTVVEGAAYFAHEHGGVTGNPKVRVVVDDIATHLHTTDVRYNVVSADEKTAQEYASNGFSYSKEYYELVRDRLAPGGLMAQWVPTSLPPRQYRMVLRTFTSAFPHGMIWYFAPAFQSAEDHTILIGSNERIVVDPTRMRRWLEADSVAFAGLAHYGLDTPEEVLAHFVSYASVLKPALEAVPENTLAHPRYEFYSPAEYAVPSRHRFRENFQFLMELRAAGGNEFWAELERMHATSDTLGAMVQAENEFLAGYETVLAHDDIRAAAERFEAALALAPWNESLRIRILTQYWYLAMRYANSGDRRVAAGLMRRGLAVYDDRALNWAEYALVLHALRQTGHAIEAGRRAVELDPELVAGHKVLVDAYVAAGERDLAREHLDAWLAIDPESREALRLSLSI